MGWTHPGWRDPEIKKLHEDYIINELKIRDITAFYSSEFYGAHISTALKAKNRIVDKNRVKIKISATQIRTNHHKYKEFINPIVYKDLTVLAKKAEKRYDITFLCDADFPYEDTWDRSGDLNRKWFQQQIHSDLLLRKIPFISLNGPLEERIKMVKKNILNLEKFRTL